MKVLAIMGSPRKKGNTYQVVERIKDKLIQDDKSIDFETLFISDYNLQICKGCFSCFANGKNKCPLKDDHDVLEAKMLEADGIIFAAPTYAMGVPAGMKNFIDRFAYSSHRPLLFDKAFIAVSTVGGVMGIKQTLAQLQILASGGKAIINLGISCPPVTFAGFEKRTEKKIHKASKVFYQALLRKDRKAPGLIDWAYFSSFKAFTMVDSYQKAAPADYEYYKDKEDYFYPIDGHPFRLLCGKMIKGLMKMSLRLLIKD